jgi:parallel beta-helix repeat protein
MRKSVFKLVGLGAALVLVTLAVGAIGTAQKTITVCPSGCDFTSIQAAIQAAPEGAAIQVKAGTYKESLTITKPLSLVGEGAGKTVIEGGVAVLATKVVFLAGFTVKGGQGVQLQDSQTVALTEVAIVEGRGDGLAVVNSGTVTVRASTIQNSKGSGIVIALGSKAVISANEIVGNKGDGIAIGASQADVRDNVIAGNSGCGIRADVASQVTGGGNREGSNSFATIQEAINAFPVPPEQQANMGGAVCGTASRDLFTGSILVTGEAILIGPGTYRENLTITKSVVLRGAGRDKTIITSARESTPVVLVRSDSQIQVTLEGLALTGASGSCSGYPDRCPIGLVVMGQARVTVQNSTISGNGYDGLGVRDSAQVTLQNSTVSGNAGNGLAVRDSARVTVQNSTISGNGSDGLYVGDSAQVTLQNSTISGNGSDGLLVGSSARAWVIGNTFLNNKDYGIWAYSTDNIVECRGNRFEGNGSGPYNDAAAQKCR